MKTRSVLLLSLSLFACSTLDASPAPAVEPARPSPSALEAAQEAYLRGDWLTMTDRIHDVLLDRGSTQLVQENAFELLDKGYEATNGKLPSRLVLPKGIQFVKLGVLRAQHHWATYRNINIYMRLDQGLGAHVKDVSLRTQPGNVPILDRAAGIGDEWRVDTHPNEKADEVVFEAKHVSSALPDGVTTLRIALDDGREIDTWFIARGLSSSASPEIAAPTQAATFSDPSPTLQWAPFRSPEYTAFEDRTLSVWVADEKTNKSMMDRWVFQPGDLAQMKVEPRLPPGSYWFALTAGEERSFGPIRITRTSQRGVPFSVVP